MTITEKISYIKGLADGLKLDENKDEVKVLNAIVDLLDDISLSVTDLEDTVEEMGEQLDAVDEDLAELEEDFEDVLEDECGCDCDCDDDCDLDDDEEYYEVTCPNCGEEIVVEEEVLLCGETECPKCGEVLEFDFSSLEGDHDCDCGCCSTDGDANEEDLMS